jgi:endonuclease YncB( thermonuclease family)
MPSGFLSKGASITGAPFALWLLLHAPSALAAACPARDTGERVTVVHVYDGDTVKLADGRRVRLIGINAPELRPEQPAGEPFANEARAILQSLIDRNNRTLLLQYGRENEDHYGRLLAHAFVDNGDNVAVHLLQSGLATTLVVPPNTWAHDCYQQQEDQARIERRGIWKHPRYQVSDARSLPASTRGFRIIHATVQHVRYAGGTAWLELDGPLSVRVGRQDQVNFPAGYLERLAGKAVEIRGWVRARPSGLIMTVKHPAAMIFLSRQAP